MIADTPTNPVDPSPLGEGGPEVEITEAEPELDLDDLETEVPEGEATEEELAEIEADGKKFKIPAALKDKFLMQADYTKKTQTLAEERRQLEQQNKDFAAQQKALQNHVGEVSKLVNLDEQMAWYDRVDWIDLNRQDPVKCQEMQIQRQMLERQRNELGVKLANEWQTRVAHEQQEIAKRYEEGLAVISKSIPSWSQDYANKLTDYATKAYGASKEQLREVQLIHPGLVVVLDKAMKLDQLIAKQRAASGKPQAPESVPVTTVGSRSSPASTAPRDSDDIDTWMKKRNTQVAKRRQTQNGALRFR
jgi:uncharacterized protein (DUF3084 family)